MSKLNALKVKSITKIGMHSDGNGLYLKVQPSSKHSTINKSWIFRWGAQGKNTMGLGSVKDITLAEARELTTECSRLVARGFNPKQEREKIHAEKQAEKENSITFSEASKQYIEIHRASWKNKKHGQQWEKTLETYAFDVIGNKSCSAVTKEDVLKILTPIWTTKTETATRVRGRIESVLDWAKAKGYVKGENVAVLKGNLQALLPQIKKRQRVAHHNAMPYDKVPTFFATIKDDPSLSARALILCILTATRTTEAIEAIWDEIDLDKKCWIIPKERMKRSIEHRIPLATQVCEFLSQMDRTKNEYVFYSERSKKNAIDFLTKKSKPMSNMTMLTYLQRKDGCKELTVHGFRSSFRDWAAEKGNFQREVCEQALAHALKDPTEAAYQRGDYFEKRVELMQAWADYCLSKIKVV
jgi:integrase